MDTGQVHNPLSHKGNSLFYSPWSLQVSWPPGSPAGSDFTSCPASSQHLPSRGSTVAPKFLLALKTQILFCLDKSPSTTPANTHTHTHTHTPPAPSLQGPTLLIPESQAEMSGSGGWTSKVSGGRLLAPQLPLQCPSLGKG